MQTTTSLLKYTKTQEMPVCTKRDKTDSTALEMDGREIEPCDNVKYLGGLIYHKLHVESHVDSLVAKN